ncbi:hypothetical protein TBLA_0D03970 [Henningerozyma blattae CBS 6284]|uniref:Midasin n=1 Tax=Henningerozyma blattae (strain ATCC 34711 / CBS 6284 / DSM 70876 / NBRC 10599 / NRRL Y-10934 / UCD 77-7) TaxID=1071380 RepID=I2H3E2_HENB6|nr:hypothetical protein TBLA_0D03970 [Tetrapisispora blattae CBS 6284]CCH60894.1 hypothetical protein TBLA_0D03970 [Tetrapisispora blattae CBS 6284]
MSSNNIFLNLNEVSKRHQVYNDTLPAQKLDNLYLFDTSLTADKNLKNLSLSALKQPATLGHVFIYNEIFLEVVSRWVFQMERSSSVEVFDAVARTITVYPLSQPFIEDFLDRENERFITILQNPSSQDEKNLHKILLAYYRLLYHNTDIFTKYINPDILYTLISKNDVSDLIKFLTIKVLGYYLNMAEHAFTNTLKTHIPHDDPINGFYEYDTNVNYRFLELNEAKRFSEYSKLPQITETFIKDTTNEYFTIDPQFLTKQVVSICGVIVPRSTSEFNSSLSTKDPSSEFTWVPTDKAISTLRKLGSSIQKSNPVMLIGRAGAGKTFLINELSKYVGCQDSIVKIHLGEQTDAKLLIGTYTSGEKPGTFEWRNGVLTTAVKEGRWVLIEDIDKAPTEVLSILLTLLEKRELTIPSRGEVVKAANGFQLISTVRVSEENVKKGKDLEYVPNIIGMRIWKTIYLEEPSNDDLYSILSNNYKVLSLLIPKLIKTYEDIKNVYLDPRFISLNRGAHSRTVSVRDLVKLCKRLNILFENNGITKPNQLIETTIYDNIFAEAADCFAGAISEPRALEPLIHVIGTSLEIPASRINLFLTKHIPNFETNDDTIKIGRAVLNKSQLSLQRKSMNSTSFATTNHSLRLMEQISLAVQMSEPVLLVGETGTGKTTVVQQIAKLVNKPLTVINVSQQTETGDLLGGYKPVNSKTVAIPIQENFETLFAATFSVKKNEKFYKMLHRCFNKNQWKNVVRLWNEAFKMAKSILDMNNDSTVVNEKKKKRKLHSNDKKLLFEKWVVFQDMVRKFEAQASTLEGSFIFNFVEGSLVKAVRNGEWLLLDEVNLASADTLESISDLLSEANSRSILLSEKGDAEPVKAHPEFRIFACMNPATDVGKRDLPSGIRSRFTEIYVHSPDRDINDLLTIIDRYIGKYSVSDEWVGNDIAELYIEAKKLAEDNIIVDGANQKPHFSIRTLTRTLLYACDIIPIYGLRRSLYDGFCMSFLTLLDQKSENMLIPIIEKYTVGRLKNMKSVMSQAPMSPGEDYIQFKHYWMKKGNEEIQDQAHYIITPFVEKNLLNLVRATSGKRFPILVQGPTSAGKTSMIKHLADVTGHKFVRINNHEHTDLQEYLGTYVTDDTGKLSFREGILVEALRKGYWIVLDELNLAPTDVLEALNRLLDDNRELFIPETQEVVHPHPNFMLFATQNPPGIYGGRKVLSRAFRNRFLELHFDDIPQDELEIILRERCQIAPSYAKKIVEVYRQLSIERSASRLFEQKNSFATLRDLFRWALRDAIGYEELAANGYMLLAERCRTTQERVLVQNVLQKVMKVKLNMQSYYSSLENKDLYSIPSSVIWTNAMKRLAVLVESCLKNNEPVLLVGETGCGKTTICQLLSAFMGKELISLNAHQNTETGDILGAQRPVRNRSELQYKLINKLKEVLQLPTDEIEGLDVDTMFELYEKSDKSLISEVNIQYIKNCKEKLNILFEWSDGPLIQALKAGNFFLLDEISLADDSVLERLNSVLEPERSLLLAEKGSSDSLITAKEGFQFFSTMNPSGDYGKKELSPALRNRFTEIWVPSMEDFNDVKLIVSSKLSPPLKEHANSIVDFSEWFAKKFGGGNVTSGVISLRDILAWVEFMNKSFTKVNNGAAVLTHGALMVFIDALGTNNTAYLAENESHLKSLKLECISVLSKISNIKISHYIYNKIDVAFSPDTLTIGLFSLNRNIDECSIPAFDLNAPTTAANMMRVVRAMQVHKPILLEGSPGVGKTSLITALAEMTGNKLTRINLSEQTDLVDLFGSDAPGEKTGEFVWRDAPFLRAMQKGEWVLLDEMNLASQSVLEGLNACLDHRGEAYIPELDKSFSCHPNFIVFAAQNPQYQGGGRKGLPKSFVNRFSVVYVDMLTANDLLLIAHHLYPKINKEIISKIIKLISTVEDEVTKKKLWGSAGTPWEFNLRDTLRWLKLLNKPSICGETVMDFVNIVIQQRFRTDDDRQRAQLLITNIFGDFETRDNYYKIDEDIVQINSTFSTRNKLYQYPNSQKLIHLQCNNRVYESALKCINNNWPLILTGPTGSGKTDIIKFLASILGAKLDFFSMNSDIDSMDILGGYEQVDLTRKISYISNDLKTYITEIISLNLGLKILQPEAIIAAFDLLHFISKTVITTSNFSVFHAKFNILSQFLNSNNEWDHFIERVNRMSSIISKEESIRFEWFDGMLIEAVEKGHWLVLENANLCSPSVLDRLNSLLEDGGSLIINECSFEDGKPRVLNPHPNFRLFLTVNPKYGELSRAMRNRGVEIYVDELKNRLSIFDSNSLKESVLLKQTESRNITEALPLKHYIPACNSSMFEYAVLHDIFSQNNVNISAAAASSLLSFRDIQKLHQWKDNVISNRIFLDDDFAIDVDNLISFYKSLNVYNKLNSLYSPVGELLSSYSPKTTADIQHLNPMLNVYFISTLIQNAPKLSSEETAYLFASLGLLLHNEKNLELTLNKAINGKVNDLSYLQLSAAIINGRTLKIVPRIPIFGILKSLENFIINYIRRDELYTEKASYYQIWKLLIIWNCIFETSSIKDEARLRVYKSVLENWTKEASAVGIIADEVSSIIIDYDKMLDVQKGKSMNIIWDRYRKRFPSTEEGWSLWSSLNALSTEFDSVSSLQFSESYDFISDLRDSFVIIAEDILSNNITNIDELFSTLKDGMNHLNAISGKFLNKRKHYLTTEFDYLLRLLSSSQGNRKSYKSIISLSSVSTAAYIKIQTNSHSYPSVFDLLWSKNSDDKFISYTTTLIDTSFFENILIKSINLKKFTGSQILQTLNDATTLLSSTIDLSGDILINQYHVFNTHLDQWIRDIIQLHANIDVTQLKIGEICKVVIDNCPKYFIDVFNNYLLPVLQYLQEPPTSEFIGKSWILFGVALINLYAPDAPVDPAINDYVLYDIFEKHRDYTQGMIDSWQTIRSISSGNNKLLIETGIKTISDNDKPSKPMVYRSTSSIDNLYDEWSAFLDSTISDNQVVNLLQSMDETSEVSHNRLNMFQQNSSHFLNRMDTAFYTYADVNEIFKGYIICLKLGFDLVKQAKLDAKKPTSLSRMWSIDPLQVISISNINTAFTEISTLMKKGTINSLITEDILIFFLNLLDFHKSDSDILPLLSKVLQMLYYRWSLRRMKDEEAQQNNANLYKFKDNSEDYEEDFKQMFPDYENVVSLDDTSAELLDDNLETLYYNIAKNYIKLFSDGPSNSLKETIISGSRVSELLIDIPNYFKSHLNTGSQLSAILNIFSNEISAFQDTVSDEDIDFYNGFSISESQKSIMIIDNLWHTVNSLLEQWPEHATLRELFRICEEYLNYSVETPISRLLQKLEQIYTFVVEWEKYAASKVSLEYHSKRITDQIVSWRKLELKTWNNLFKFEDIKLEKNIGKWWFYLFETLIATESNHDADTKNNTSILSALNIFLSKSTVGEFSSRLAILRAFENHVSMISNVPLLHAIQNSISYYSQFLPSVSEYIKKGRKTLEKDIKEVILLASWKDVNVDALKQSSRRSHNSLYKIVRKYRQLLSTETFTIIESGIPSTDHPLLKSYPLVPITPRYTDITAAKKLLSSMTIWNDRTTPLRNVHLVSRNMSNYLNKLSAYDIPYLDTIAKEYLKVAERLRSETPSVYSKEVKKTLSALKAQKSKSLSDALKELKRIGLKTNFRDDIHKVQSTATTILANSSSFSSTPIKNSDSYFFRILDILPRLRSHASNPADDIPITSIERGMAICENLIFSLITIRKPIYELTKKYDTLDSLRSNFEKAYLTVGDMNRPYLQTSMTSVSFFCKWLPVLLDYASETILLINNSSDEEIDISLFKQTKDKLSNFSSRIVDVQIFDGTVSTILSEFDSFLTDFSTKLRDMKSPNTLYIIDLLLSWMENNRKLSPEVIETSIPIDDIDASFRKIYTSILLVFQKFIEVEIEPLSEEDDKWLSTASQNMMKNMKLLHIKNVLANMESTFSLLKSCKITDKSETVRAIVSFTMPVINHYYTLVNTILENARKYYSRTSYGAFILCVILDNLSKNGFCSPEPPSEEVDDKNLHEGTGMGDGEGAENNSNDIDQDEDLTEDAQTENKEQDKDKNEDENDNNEAVDMEGDMAGDLEDLSDQEGDEEQSEPEEEDQLDEEIDDLGEDDPNAVDEKMWNEEPEEDTKEKDTDQQLDNSGDNDDVQANDEEDKENIGENENASKEDTQQDNDNDKNNEEQNNIDENGNETDGSDNQEDDEEELAEQEDNVKNESNEELEQNVPDVDTMDLPDDIDLESDENEEAENNDVDDNDNLSESDEEMLDNLDSPDNLEKEEENSKLEEDQNIGSQEDSDIEEEEEMDIDTDNKKQGDTEDVDDDDDDDDDEMKKDMSDEELIDQENNQDDTKEKSGEEYAEGLDGVDEEIADAEEVDTEAAIQQNSGTKGSGSDAKTEEEQDDIGTSGDTQNMNNEEQENDLGEQNDIRSEARKTLKQLGDAMKEFHKRKQEIKEASQNEKDEESNDSANQRPDEFEHVDGTNTEHETQAMGAANQEEIQSINENLAVEDDNNTNEDPNTDDIKQEEEDLESFNDENTETDNTKSNENEISDEKTGFIGEKRQIFTENEKLLHDTIMNKAYTDELDQLMEEVDEQTHEEADMQEPPRSKKEARELWHKSELSTADLVSRLSEQLRLILEPTLATKLKGDYKTGKRLNMKRIIPYIASQFRKDKIWLRRTKPSKRQYQIMIALDDSKSMSESNCVKLAFDSLFLVSKTLTQLESGGLSVVKFGENIREVHPFDKQFSDDAGSNVFQWFGFKETKTDIKRLVAESIKIFERARMINNSDQWQLEIIISDGICEDHSTIERLVRRARENKIMLVFVIIDGINSNESIMDMSQVKYVPDHNGNMQLKIDKYLDTFPFEFYVVVHNVSELPEMLSVILRQYFSDLASS